MNQELNQLEFIALEVVIKRYDETGKGMRQGFLRSCTQEKLEALGFIQEEECCECLEPTKAGREYVKKMKTYFDEMD